MSDLLPPNLKRCTQCGAEQPADGTNGLCPACLMAEAMKPSGPKKPWEPPSAEDLAKLLPQYEITRMLGRGGMGAVYQGTQKSLDRTVAIKILSHDLESGDASFAERFKNEARAMAKLTHPGIVAVYDSGETADGLLYIVMEFIEGTDVARMMAKDKRLHSEHAMAITAHVCDALAYAHDRGIIHRDIKPANIMVGYDGVVKVADFGLAKISQEGKTGLTQSGMAMGTLYYMAPEALTLGTGVDQRADIYAVGVMLYQMLTGKLPQGLFELPSLQVPGLDPRYDGIIGKALREDRNLRYPRTQDMRHDLDAILTQPVVKVEAAAEKAPAALETQARPQRPAGQPYRPPQSQTPVYVQKKSSPLPWVAVLVVIGLAAWFLFGRSKNAPITETVVETSVPKTEPKADEGSKVKVAVPSAPVASQSTVEASTPKVSPSPVSGPPADMIPPAAASKNKPFVNSLGMKFVPVPITGGPSNGKLVLFSIWETRVQDYQDFAKEKKREWPKPRYEQGPTHPAVHLDWNDAQDFCTWLNERERKAGWLKSDEQYRLPSDHEWSCAVGIGEQEDAAMPPKDKHMKLANTYPWGTKFPPPVGAGSYNGEEAVERSFSSSFEPMIGYRDAFPAMAPVGSFAVSSLGLFDLGGNAWEWCLDSMADGQPGRVLRGACFLNHRTRELLSSFRIEAPLTHRSEDKSFRIVLESAKSLPTISAAKTASNLPPELAALDQQFIKLQAESVTVVFDADVAKLNSGYLGGLDREMAKEKAAGRQDGVMALEAEKKLIAAKQPVPSTDDASTHVALKNLRSIYRDAYAKMETARMTRLKALTDPLALRLKTLEADLAKQNRTADAKAVRDYRESLPVSPAPENTAAYSATNPFINSLGMKFVPVPGTEILFCTHLTRRVDYAAFDAAVPRVDPSWKTQPKDNKSTPVNQEDDYPVVGVSWTDAKAFGDWLTVKEGHTYRLPTDREWSYAVGIGPQEEGKKNASAESLNGKIKGVYPWGTQWPPPKGAGNFADTSHVAMFPGGNAIPGYTDGYPLTSPVFAFKPNKLGIHDLGGNIHQWCEGWFDEARTKRLSRGTPYNHGGKSIVSSWRTGFFANDRLFYDIGFSGFRCVVVASSLKGGSTAAIKTTPSVSTTTTPLSSASAPQATTRIGLRPIKTTYQNKAGVKEDRFAWKGEHVAILSVSGNLDPGVMAGLADTLDKVYEFHQEATGREPRKTPVFQELAITVEDDTSKSGMSTGVDYSVMWMKAANFRNFYTSVAERGEYSLGWFREFGLNTWYYASKLTSSGPAPIDAFPSGYCVLMRTLSTERLGIKLDPMKGGGQDWREGIEEMLELYLADQSLSFSNTVAIGQAPVNPAGFGSPELFASFCLHLCKENGGDAYNTKLWHEVGKSPDAKTTQEGIDNFILAACAAADKDLSDLFTSQWRWPMSAQAVAKAKIRRK